MMKKNGFTLAEVLITLAIIGVVATLTLPALMTNTAEQQAKTALKKGINTLTEAAQMNQAIAGFDYASLTSSDTEDSESQSLYGLLTSRASIDYQKSGVKKLISQTGSADETASENMAIFFRDGSALLYPTSLVSTSSGEGGISGTNVMDDNLVYGIPVIFDTNGSKGPNIVSNCQGSALGSTQDSGDEDTKTACPKDKRVIKDQFGVRLRGGYVVPNGAAARWAFEN